jgi:hypothetical protein
MAKTSAASSRMSADAVTKCLRMQGIIFRGPLYSQRTGTIFIVENQLLLESELVELLAQYKLNREGIQELAKRIEARDSMQ